MPVESEAEVAAAAQSLIGQGFEAVIVTLGARGALLAVREGVRRVAPVKVQAIDTTGAGDAFIGSFARYFAAGLDLDAALAQATHYAANFGHQARRAEILRDRKPSSRRFARSSLKRARDARPSSATSALHISARHG